MSAAPLSLLPRRSRPAKATPTAEERLAAALLALARIRDLAAATAALTHDLSPATTASILSDLHNHATAALEQP